MRGRPWLWLALACHLLWASIAAVVTPAFEGPDENDHYYYAHLLAHRGLATLPIVHGSGALGDESPWRQATLGHHPPLYYWLLAGALHAADAADTVPSWSDTGLAPDDRHKWRHGADEIAPVSAEIRVLYWLRSISIVCGAVALVLAHRLGRVLFPSRPGIADLGTLCLACLPQWGFVHGVLDNGNLATALSFAALLWVAQGRIGVGLGLIVGGALLTKLTSVFLVPLVGIACVAQWFAAREAGERRAIARRAVHFAVVVLVVAGWFFARNVALYGELLATDVHRAAFASNLVPDAVRGEYLRERFVPETWRSFVGHFGWGRVAVPPVVTIGAAVAVALAFVGWCLAARRLFGVGLVERRLPTALAGIAIGLVVAALVQFNRTFFQPQGRYLFPAAAPMLLFFAAGLVGLRERLLGERAPTLRRALAIGAPIVSSFAVCAFVFVPGLGLRGAPTAVGPQASRHASLHAGVATEPAAERVTVELREPADGARLREAPTFVWDATRAGGEGPFTVHAYLRDGRILFGTFESAGIAIDGDRWTLPAGHWAMLPADTEILWKVRRIPDRARGESTREMHGSRSFRLTRVE